MRSLRGFSWSILAVLCAALMVFAPVAANASVLQQTTSVPTQLNVGESLTLTTTGGPFVIPNNGTYSNTVTIAYSWAVIAANHQDGIWMATWLGSASSALSSGSYTVPSSNILFNDPVGIPSTACNQGVTSGDTYTGTLPGATCFDLDISSPSQLTTTPTGSYSIPVQLAVATPVINPGNYTGTFNIAVVIP